MFHYNSIWWSFEIGATLGPAVWFFGEKKRGHQYAHFTVVLINHNACPSGVGEQEAWARVATASRFEIVRLTQSQRDETLMHLILPLQHREQKCFRIFKANWGWEIFPYLSHMIHWQICFIMMPVMSAEIKVAVFWSVKRCIVIPYFLMISTIVISLFWHNFDSFHPSQL